MKTMARRLVFRRALHSTGAQLPSEGKKLPREIVAAMQDDGTSGSFQEAMRAAMLGSRSPAKAAPPQEQGRLSAHVPAKLAGERLALYERLRADREKAGMGAIAGPDGALQGPFNAYVAASPAIGDALDRLAQACRRANACEPAVFELAILAVAAAHRSDYEFHAHEKLALSAGVNPDTVAAVKAQAPPDALPECSETQRAAYAYARDLLTPPSGHVADATYQNALQALGSEAALVDLTATVGLYVSLAIMLRAFKVPLPPGAQRAFPDEGR